MKGEDADGKRPDGTRAQAEGTAATEARILEAAKAAFHELPLDQISVADIAARAGLSEQTIIDRYKSLPRLGEALIARLGGRIVEQRSAVAVGDVEGAIRVLVEHYEELGDTVLRILAEEVRAPAPEAPAAMAEMGRVFHQGWCERIFAAGLEGLDGAKRDRRAAQLVAVTDVYVWKLLRRDKGLSARETELAMRELLEPLMEPTR